MLAIGLLDANDQIVECSLDGRAYYVGMAWNEAGALWTMSVRDLDRQVLVSGIRVVPLFPLLRQVRRPELPPGEIGVECVPGTVLGRHSFVDGAAALAYFTEQDMLDLAAA